MECGVTLSRSWGKETLPGLQRVTVYYTWGWEIQTVWRMKMRRYALGEVIQESRNRRRDAKSKEIQEAMILKKHWHVKIKIVQEVEIYKWKGDAVNTRRKIIQEGRIFSREGDAKGKKMQEAIWYIRWYKIEEDKMYRRIDHTIVEETQRYKRQGGIRVKEIKEGRTCI